LNRFSEISRDWLISSVEHKYSYNFTWLGRPVIQYPQDLMALQEIIWRTKPDLIIETGIAHGGSLIFYASMLELIGKGQVLGIDIDIREHNYVEISKHPMVKRISMIEGDSIDPAVMVEVREFAEGKRTMVCLDSLHTHDHVLRELELYSRMVTSECYLIVFDTCIEDLPETDRPWGKGNNPKTALDEFLKSNDRFVVENLDKLMITVAPGGYLRCVSE